MKIPGINFQEALWQLTWRKVSHYPRIEVNDLLIEFFTLLLPHLTNPPPELRLGNSNLKEQTATSINGITFKLPETNGEYEGVCLNPKDIPPDDLDDVILGRMIKEAGVFYKMELERVKGVE